MSSSDEAAGVLAGVKLPVDHPFDETLRLETYTGVLQVVDGGPPETPAATRAGPLRISATPPLFARPNASLPLARSDDELELVEVLGEGGMGRVLLARQRALGREVAVKVLRRDVSHPGAEQLLVTEARTTGALEHPNVVPVHLLGSDEQGRPALVMKRVEGVPWRTLLDDDKHPLWQQLPYFRGEPLAAHLEVLTQVCNGLQYAHSRGVLHRDVKPENVMLGAFGEVYLMDWGIAISLEEAGAATDPASHLGPIGTPVYMAPEMVRQDPLDERTDIFLLGAVLHEVLTGSPRHAGTNILEVLHAALTPSPIAYGPEVPEELAELANRATARAPADRPRSVAELRSAIGDYLTHRSSLLLSHTAQELLDEIESRERSGPPDPVTVERLIVECRFGFLQALKAWPGSGEARRGLQAVLTRAFRRAIARADLATAQALLGEFPDPDATLDAELAAEERRLSAQRHEQAHLDGIASEMDLRVAGRQRRRFFGVIATIALLWNVASFGARVLGYQQFTAYTILRFAVTFAVVMTALTVFSRRTLFVNKINRRLALLPAVAAWVLVAHRALGVLRDRPIAEIVADDLFLLTVVAGVAAVVQVRAYFITALVFLLGGLAALLVPDWAQECFSLAGLGGVITVFGYWVLFTPLRTDKASNRT